MTKTAWITGASAGIGKALSQELAKNGYDLILSARNEEALNEVKGLCEAHNVTAHVLPLDLAKQEAIVAAVADAKKLVKSLDLLVNNGGISQRSLVAETPIEIDRKIFEVNFFGAIRLTKECLPWMIETGGGTMAAMSSMVGRFGFPLRSAYAASKHALHGFFESLYLENHNKGIKTLMICPGRIKTNVSVNALTAEGEAFSKMADGQAGGLSTEACAKKIYRAYRKGKREVWVGGKEILMMYFRKWIPSLFFRIAKKIDPT